MRRVNFRNLMLVPAAMTLVACATQTPEPVVPPTVTAQGNEPAWQLNASAERLELSLDYAQVQITGLQPQYVELDAMAQYYAQTEQGPLTVTLVPQTCRDSMSGQSYPQHATVEIGEKRLRGCAGEPHSLLQPGKEWQVEDLANRGIIDMSHLTLRFDGNGRVAGSSGCNRFMGGYEVTGEGLKFSPLAGTMMACPPALMNQERDYLKLLQSVKSFTLDETGALLLETSDGKTILAR